MGFRRFFALTGVAYFREAFGIDAAQAGITPALFFMPFAVLQYPVNSLFDRIGRFLPVVGSVLYGYLPAFIAAGGLEITIVTVASRDIWKITSHERGPVPGGGN